MPHPLTKAQQGQLKKLGEQIKAIREAKGLTMEEVAVRIGKDRQSIFKLEKGSFNPSYIYLSEVCKGLDISLAELFK